MNSAADKVMGKFRMISNGNALFSSKKRQIMKKVLYCFLFALFAEIFLFNIRSIYSSKEHDNIQSNYYFEDGTALEWDKSYDFSSGTVITSDNIDAEFRNIYFKIRDCNNRQRITLHLVVQITDEGHAEYYTAQDMLISPLIETSLYIPIEPFGKVDKIKFIIAEDIEGVSFDSIIAGTRTPFFIRKTRILVMWLMALIVSFLLSETAILTSDRRIQRAICLIVLFCNIALALHIQNETIAWGSDYGYADLADAFLDGRNYVAECNDEAVLNFPNLYDYGHRGAEGVDVPWDTAYYNGRYYIYFGAVPAVLLYVPYKWITGNPLGDITAAKIVDVLILIISFFFINELRKKFCKNLDYRLFLLMFTSFSWASILVLIVKRSAIYYIAIGMAYLLVIAGITLWLNSHDDAKLSIWKAMLGSLCMALAVGCRPQFAIASFFGLIVFKDLFAKDKSKILKLIMVILPYFPVAYGLMMYNYYRFGSVFDFGANYNLTKYDMVHMGIHISRIPIGIWYYLLQLPQLSYEFPYLNTAEVHTSYPGFIVSEPVIGGALMLIPFCWLCFFDLRHNDYKRTLAIRRVSYLMTLVVVVADTLMCGVLTRYQADYRLYMILPAVLIAMEMAGVEGDRYAKRYRLLVILSLITLVFCLFTVFAQYEGPDFIEYNTIFYLRLKELFGF